MTISNTSKMDTADMLGLLVGGMGGDPSAPILAQEAQGQRQVVNSTSIPTDTHSPAAEFEALGFVLGEVHADDPMWRECTLPAGWSREGSSHSMWSYIIDERGFRRCSIFYKAAFYDRSAHIGITREPETKAQNETYAAFAAEFDSRDGEWQTYTSRRDGDNLVRVARRHVLDADGRRVYDVGGVLRFEGDAHEWVIAPDGEVIEKRTVTT